MITPSVGAIEGLVAVLAGLFRLRDGQEAPAEAPAALVHPVSSKASTEVDEGMVILAPAVLSPA